MQCGIEIGGWCPPGRACESGTIPPVFPLLETFTDTSPIAPDIPHSQRTEWNVGEADATLILKPATNIKDDPGTDWTSRCAINLHRPILTCDPFDPEAFTLISGWLESVSAETLNIAGPSESSHPCIGDTVYALLVAVFSRH